MARNDINSNFYQIAVTDSSDNVVGIRAAIANVQLTGGTSGQVITTNGSGGLSWATPSSSSPTTGSVESTQTQFINQNTTTATATTVLTFTLPSAGTWDVSYFIRAAVDAAGRSLSAALFTPAGAVITGTENVLVWSSGTSGMTGTVTNREFITTTGTATYTVRAWQDGGTSQSIAQQSYSNGRTIVKWVKIG